MSDNRLADDAESVRYAVIQQLDGLPVEVALLILQSVWFDVLAEVNDHDAMECMADFLESIQAEMQTTEASIIKRMTTDLN